MDTTRSPQQSARQADRQTESNSPSEKRTRSKKGRKSKVSVGVSEGRAEEEAGVAPGGRQSRIIRADQQHEPCWCSRSKTNSYYCYNNYVLLFSKQFSLKCFQWALGLHWIKRE